MSNFSQSHSLGRTFRCAVPVSMRTMNPGRRDLGSRCSRSAWACPLRFLDHRSAWACPPRSPSSSGGVLGPLGLKRARRFFFRSPHSVVCARLITNRSRSGDLDLQGLASERWRGTGPRPTMKCRFFSYRGGLSPTLSIVKRWRFRSVRTYMSIAARVVPFSRSFRSLIKTRGPGKILRT